MAFQSSGVLGCSGCLIEAIVLHDERILRKLRLSATDLEYSDTHWVPRVSPFSFMTTFPNSSRGSPMPSQLNAEADLHCTHPLLAETLEAGEPANIALSVILMSMLYSRTDFNGLQMLIESGKFDLSEPLIFHMKKEKAAQWSLVALDSIGAAILIDIGSECYALNSYLLINTVARLSFTPECRRTRDGDMAPTAGQCR